MKAVISFVAGAAIGSLLAWKFAKDKYERIAQEEIDNVKEYYKECAEEEAVDRIIINPPREEMVDADEEDVKDVKNIIEENGYQSDSQKGEGTGHPYVITPEDFASSNQYYDKISLSMYTGGEITDEDSKLIYTSPEIENMIGIKNLDRMGEYERGVLYVRNDILQTDYEVIEEGESIDGSE